jgi:hypothetical protein
MKTYKVWIEVEEFDSETASTAEFNTPEEAERFAERLHATGQQLAKEHEADERDGREESGGSTDYLTEDHSPEDDQ